MSYEKLKGGDFFSRIQTEEQAREWLWACKFGGKPFCCPHCQSEKYWAYQTRPEVRKCASCDQQIRIRSGTIFQNSKLPLLTWFKALYFVMQGKRGISALELRRQVGLKFYATAWAMLHKIREALRQRDERYKLKQLIELDGATFGKKDAGQEYPPPNQVLVAIESRDWVDEEGKPKVRAGFAKICVKPETSIFAQDFVKNAISPGSSVNTDGDPAYLKLEGVDHDYRVMDNDPEKIKHWLPWVHKFISNAKAWLLGTHHHRKTKYLDRYLAEYTYRFNRRHDPDSLFHRALTACALAKPKTYGALF
jgi:hypothetical protein